MQLSLRPQDLSLNHLLLHVKEAIEHHPTLIKDLESLIHSLKRKHKNTSYVYDHTKKALLFKGEIIKLSHKEVLFLELLIVNNHRLVTYTELQYHVWEDAVMTDNSVRSLVRNLRKKLPDGLISNLSKTGYRLNSHSNFSSF